MQCDPTTGSCLLPDEPSDAQRQPTTPSDVVIRYVGDPMCSWCWGISPVVKKLAEYCEQHGLSFVMTMGGLRAGGGDAWNSAFKDFLRGEWSHIQKKPANPSVSACWKLSNSTTIPSRPAGRSQRLLCCWLSGVYVPRQRCRFSLPLSISSMSMGEILKPRRFIVISATRWACHLKNSAKPLRHNGPERRLARTLRCAANGAFAPSPPYC